MNSPDRDYGKRPHYIHPAFVSPQLTNSATLRTLLSLACIPNCYSQDAFDKLLFHIDPRMPDLALNDLPKSKMETSLSTIRDKSSTGCARLTDLPMDVLRRIMLLTMEQQDLDYCNNENETFLNASDSTSLRNGINLGFSCRKMFDVFQDSLTGVKLVSSWQTEQNTLVAACKAASQNLRAIHVECSAPVTGALREVVRMRPPIRHFVLIGVYISKLLLADIIYFVGHSLEKLVVSAAPSLDDCVVDLISTKCERLRYLELGGSRHVTSESLINLFANIGQGLLGIELNALQHDSLDEQVLFSAALNCSSLRYIRLLKLRWLTDACLGYFFKLRAHQLTEVRLEACRRISYHTLCLLGRYVTVLRKLDCTFAKTKWTYAHVPEFMGVSCIECHDQSEVDDNGNSSLHAGERAIVQLSRRCIGTIRDLSICDAIISDKAIEQLSFACTSLERLTLRHCLSLGDQTLQAIGNRMTILKYLDVSYLPLITDEGMDSLLSSLHGSLRELQIIGCKGLSDRTAHGILPCHGGRLQVVRLSFCNFSRQAISKLRASLPRVTLCGTSKCRLH